jgi:PleD family two-component response regulator
VTLLAGIAEWGRHGSSLTALLGAADAALYTAKQAGRNRVAVAA